MRVVKFLLPLAIITVGGAVFWYLTGTATPPEPLQAEARAPVVSVRAADKVTAAPQLRLFGRVESARVSALTAGIEADVATVAVLEGDAVRAGQALVELDDADAALQLRSRRAELADLDAQLEADEIRHRSDLAALAREEELLKLQSRAVARAAELARTKSGSEAALDQAREAHERRQLAVIQRRQVIDDYPARRRQMQARRDRAAAALQTAARAHARTRIAAPFAGRVTAVFVARGERVGVGGRLVEVYDASQLELRAQVPSGYLPALRRALADGQAVTATLSPRLTERGGGGDGERPQSPTLPRPQAVKRARTLTLHRLSAQVGDGQGGVDAFFRAAGGDELPAPGSTVAIDLALPAIDNVVVLSPDSLYGRARIYLVQDGKLQAKTVRRLGRINAPADGDGDGARETWVLVDGDDFEDGDLILDSRLPQAINNLQVQVAPAAD